MATIQQTAAKRGKPSESDGVDENEKARTKQRAVRRRAPIACEECRMRKRRCDGVSPACGACMRRLTKCEYASENQVREWRSSLIQSLRSQISELEKDDRNVRSADNAFQISQKEAALVQPELMQASVSSTVYPPSINERLEKLIDPPALPQGRMSSDLSEPQSGYSPEVMEICNVEKMMKPINQIIDERQYPRELFTNSRTTEIGCSPLKFPGSRSTNVCKCVRILNTQRQWCLPPRRRSDELVTRYFSRNNIPFPVLHEATFRRQYALLWDSHSDQRSMHSAACAGLCKQKSQGQLFFHTVYALFSMAMLFEPEQSEQNSRRADVFFQMAQEVNFFEILDSEVGIELVQLLLLMGRYLQSTERLSKFKNISSLAIRMAQNMGLHYDLEEAQQRGLLSSHATQLENEMRARIWYGCVLLEKDIPEYLSIGRPLISTINGKKIMLPSAIDDDRLSEEVGRTAMQPSSLPSLLEPFIQIIKLCDILGQAVDRGETSLDKGLDEAISTQLILRLDAAIIEWRNSLPTYLQFNQSLDGNSWIEAPTFAKDLDRHSCLQKQAKKLYLRYLNARQLILRPALEQYFQKQQSIQALPSVQNRDIGIADMMLSRIAAECIVSAMTIVEVLGTRAENQDYMAWWFNVAFLHTCGSTLLMGRICTFPDAPFTDESLTTRWNLCLKSLERYTGLSSIARKSLYLLQLSAKRLILPNRVQIANHGGRQFGQVAGNGAHQECFETVPQHQPLSTGAWPSREYHLQANIHSTKQSMENPMDKDNSLPELSKSSTGMDQFLEPELRFGDLQDLDDDFWGGGTGRQNWPLIPSLPQLETLSPPFDL